MVLQRANPETSAYIEIRKVFPSILSSPHHPSSAFLIWPYLILHQIPSHHPDPFISHFNYLVTISRFERVLAPPPSLQRSLEERRKNKENPKLSRVKEVWICFGFVAKYIFRLKELC